MLWPSGRDGSGGWEAPDPWTSGGLGSGGGGKQSSSNRGVGGVGSINFSELDGMLGRLVGDGGDDDVNFSSGVDLGKGE